MSHHPLANDDLPQIATFTTWHSSDDDVDDDLLERLLSIATEKLDLNWWGQDEGVA